MKIISLLTKFGFAVFFCMLYFLAVTYAQDKEKKKIIFSVLTGPFISNDGVNVFIEAQITLNKNSIYFGPTFTQTNSSSMADSYRGLKAGYKRQITLDKDVCSFIGIDYQYYTLSSIVKTAYSESGHNLHHELNLYYGFDKKLLKNINLWFGSDIGIGVYLENYHFHKTDGDFSLSGYSRYVDLYLHYKL